MRGGRVGRHRAPLRMPGGHRMTPCAQTRPAGTYPAAGRRLTRINDPKRRGPKTFAARAYGMTSQNS